MTPMWCLLRVLVALAPAVLAAQESGHVASTDTVFLRAQRLVVEGQGDAGRALVEAELRAAAADSPRYVQALFWRAALAETAAEAERDYKRIIVEHPLSPWAADALLRLAQLEHARGDRERAMAHVERLMLEHPARAGRPQTAYWLAGVLFEHGDTARACSRLAEAERNSAPGDVELRNRIEYLSQRCVRIDTAAVAVADTTTSGATPGDAAAPSGAPTSDTGEPAAGDSAAFTVQVAAYSTRREAERLQNRLRARGYQARIAGDAKPYRVRIGRYPTQEEAREVMRQLKSEKVSGFVTEAESP